MASHDCHRDVAIAWAAGMLGTDQRYRGARDNCRMAWVGTEKADNVATRVFTRDSVVKQPSSLNLHITTSFGTG